MRCSRFLVPLALPCAAAIGCATTGGADRATPASPPPSFFQKSVDDGRILVGGQPTKADFEAFKARGVTQVINLRTAEEMKGVDFDEVALVEQLGMSYLSLPIDGSPAYTPELLEAFAQRVSQSQGKVVLHCTSGARAGQLYAAYAVKYLGKTPDEAYAALKPLGGWPLAMERLLGRPLSVQFKDAAK
ncbi:MAG: protein tyrosine phosphatase family protein [Acidobacteria bacterium]|nr:protein tyrosine phosphatase family protein [Acidobacteriota bacterium]